MPTFDEYLAVSKRGNQLPVKQDIDPTDLPIFYDIETGRFYATPFSNFTSGSTAIDETYLGAVTTSGATTTEQEIEDYINAQGFTVNSGQIRLLKVILQIESTAYVRYYALKSGVSGEYGTAVNNEIEIGDLQFVSEKKFSATQQTTQTIDLGEIGATPIDTSINNGAAEYALEAGTIYVFSTLDNSVEKNYLYVGVQPNIIGGGANDVTADDFTSLNEDGSTGAPDSGITTASQLDVDNTGRTVITDATDQEDYNNKADGALSASFQMDNMAEGANKKILTAILKDALIRNISTGVHGCILSINADNTKFDISAGIQINLNRNDFENPIFNYNIIPERLANDVSNLASATASHIYLTADGSIFQSTSPPTGVIRKTHQYLGQLGHSNNSSIANVLNAQNLAQPAMELLRDLIGATGNPSTGMRVRPNGANYQINIDSGTMFGEGIGTVSNPNNKSFDAVDLLTFRERNQNGGSGTSTSLDVGNYDNNGVTTSLNNNRWSNKRVFRLENGNVIIQRAQQHYGGRTAALTGIGSEDFVVLDNVKDARLLGYITVKSNANSALSGNDFKFTQASSSGGGSASQEPSTVTSVVDEVGAITAQQIADAVIPLTTVDGGEIT